MDRELPVDPFGRANMSVRVPRAREFLAEVETLGLWDPPSLVDEVLAAAEDLPVPEPTVVAHGDLHLRHLLVGERGEPAGVIDWIDVSRNDPCVDLVLFWCALPPAGRDTFLQAYGPLSEEQLLRGRVVALFICAVLAVYGQHEGMETLRQSAVAGLARTCR